MHNLALSAKKASVKQKTFDPMSKRLLALVIGLTLTPLATA